MKLIAVIAGSLAEGFSIRSLHAEGVDTDAKVMAYILAGQLAEALPVAAPEGEPVDLAEEDLALFVVAGTLASGFTVAGPFVDNEEAQTYAAASVDDWQVFALDLQAERARDGQ